MIHEIIARLEAIGRERALTQHESEQLERAMRRSARKAQRPWLPKDELALKKAFRKRKRVPEIAIILGRSERCVWSRIQKLRRKGEIGYISPVGGTGRYSRRNSKAD